MVGFEGGGNQQVLPRRQRKALRHLPHVDVGPASGFGGIVAKEVFTLMILIVWSLEKSKDGVKKERPTKPLPHHPPAEGQVIWPFAWTDLVDGKANGLQVHTLLPQSSSVLLHQSDDNATDVVVIIISVLQKQLKLRVGPEGVWDKIKENDLSKLQLFG